MEVSLHQHHCKATCGALHGFVHGHYMDPTTLPGLWLPEQYSSPPYHPDVCAGYPYIWPDKVTQL
jgi:hypothetical protein